MEKRGEDWNKGPSVEGGFLEPGKAPSDAGRVGEHWGPCILFMAKRCFRISESPAS